jgi:hypothetical protein
VLCDLTNFPSRCWTAAWQFPPSYIEPQAGSWTTEDRLARQAELFKYYEDWYVVQKVSKTQILRELAHVTTDNTQNFSMRYLIENADSKVELRYASRIFGPTRESVTSMIGLVALPGLCSSLLPIVHINPSTAQGNT